MGLRLSTPRDTGDYDTVDYQDIRVASVTWDLLQDRVLVQYQFGNWDDTTGQFTPGFESLQDFVIRDVPGGDQDYTTFFNETFKQGNDTNAERVVEMITNLLSLRLGLPGATVKPGRSGRRVI